MEEDKDSWAKPIEDYIFTKAYLNRSKIPVARKKSPSCVHRDMKEYMKEYRHRTGMSQPYDKAKQCSLFLGVFVAEKVLSLVFKNVTKMEMNHPGYDFICGKGYKIDVKSSCGYDRWQFVIRENRVADFFLCLAFDNRENLNPQFLWLIPGDVINKKTAFWISKNNKILWEKYEYPIESVINICNKLKEEENGMP